MSHWNPAHYLKYGDERTRAAVDLAAQVRLDQPSTIADLGCGPGNSTQILRNRWPDSKIIGVDNSSEMIDAAEESFSDQTWILADVTEWASADPIDLVFSNAALQWIPEHDRLMQHLFAMVAPGGALAFQIPSNTYATVRKLIHDVSYEADWTERMEGPRNVLTMESPSFYYDALVEQATKLDLWETEYNHVMESKDSIVDWIASTGLRPFLALLESEQERDAFLVKLRCRVADAYETRNDGKVLYPFRRTFVIAYR